jgi:hypothetical protein
MIAPPSAWYPPSSHGLTHVVVFQMTRLTLNQLSGRTSRTPCLPSMTGFTLERCSTFLMPGTIPCRQRHRRVIRMSPRHPRLFCQGRIGSLRFRQEPSSPAAKCEADLSFRLASNTDLGTLGRRFGSRRCCAHSAYTPRYYGQRAAGHLRWLLGAGTGA